MSHSVARTSAHHPTSSPAAPILSTQAARGSQTKSRATILLIEDDPAVRESLRRVLEANGWMILVAETGEAALEILRHQTPDLMITDLCLSNVSGWDLLFHENLQRPDLPIFVITGLPLHAMKGAAKFAAECFQKPLDLEVLLAAVRSYLGPSGPEPALPGNA